MVDGGPLLYLMQAANGSFPTGAYTHSIGYETLVAQGRITDGGTLEAVSRDWLQFGLAATDGVALALAHRAAAVARFTDVLNVDSVLGASKLARETYEASTKTGAAFIWTASSALPGPALDWYRTAIRQRHAAGHAAVAFALGCVDYSVPARDAVMAYLHGAFSNLILVAARLIPLGQIEAHGIIARARPRIVAAADRALIARDLSSATALLDAASMRHERLYSRLCMS